MKLQIRMHAAAKQLTALALCLTIALAGLIFPEAALAGDTGVTSAKVVLRKSADKESKALQSVPEGEEVDILKTSGDWYKVRYGNFTGYMMKKYVKVSGATSSKVSSSSLPSSIAALGSAPGIMRPGDSNTDVEKLQKALKILGYYDGSIDGKYGNGTMKAVKEYQKDEGLTADGYAGERTVKHLFGSCSSKSLTTQAAPGSSSSSVSTSTSSSSSSSSKYKTVNSIEEIGSAPGRCEQGDKGSNVVKVQQALECLGYYKGAIDGVFGSGTAAAVKTFQAKRGMKADGIVGPSTIRVLFGEDAAQSSSSSKKYKTEVLDWFADDVDDIIPKNARFTIKDVYTGKTFEAVRWSGYNHIDAEPRTAADTATMKSIYGGSWSWNRRPILILYNGHVYAASMNGMPHGTTTISGNNFDGHFCIHFKNSKTHETARVDGDHQSAVTRAGKASW